jgi:hypothetical protein
VNDERLTNSFLGGEIPQVNGPFVFLQDGKVDVVYPAGRM